MEIGSMAISLKGHDKGRCYIVIQREGTFAYVSDGAYRPLAKLKKKRLSHLKNLFKKFPEERLRSGIQDFEIKRFLKENSPQKNIC